MSDKNINDLKQKENIKVSGIFFEYDDENQRIVMRIVSDTEGRIIKNNHWIDFDSAPHLIGLVPGDRIEFDAEVIEEPHYHLGKKIIKATNIRKVENV